jgi:hypothetical protein
MFGRNFESVLTECLEAMRLGATVEDCLGRYPKQATRLRPALSLAAQVSRTPLVRARPEAESAAWRALQRRATELRTGKARPRSFRAAGTSSGWLKPVALAGAFVSAIFLSGGSVLYAAQDASPDSSLYAAKLAGEDIRVFFIFDDTHKANVLLDQSQQRMEEINQTVREGKPVPENALSAMNSRNERAVDILTGQPENTLLRERVNSQAEQQEQRLLALWPQVEAEDRTTYTGVVANLHNTQLGAGIAVADVQLRPEALSGGIFTISGLAEQGEGDVWRVGGFEVRIDKRTLGFENVKTGSGASILVAKSSNGQLQALTADLKDIFLPPTSAIVSGEVQKVTSEGITVAGQFIPFSADTIQLGPLRVGQHVRVEVGRTADGQRQGRYVAPQPINATDTFWFEGAVDSITSSQWSIGGLEFEVAKGTPIDASAGAAVVGVRVYIEATNKNNVLEAQRITVLASQAGADTVSILGTFEGYDEEEDAWKVSGLPVTPPADAHAENDPAEGSLVMIEARHDGALIVGTSLAVIQALDGSSLTRLDGVIQAIDGAHWTLEFDQVRVASTAQVTGGKPPEVGKRVIVWVTQRQDGLDAVFARILDQTPVVTPAPVVPPTPSPTASP